MHRPPCIFTNVAAENVTSHGEIAQSARGYLTEQFIVDVGLVANPGIVIPALLLRPNVPNFVATKSEIWC